MTEVKAKLWSRTRYEIDPQDIREALAIHLHVKYGIKVNADDITQFGGEPIVDRLSAVRRDTHEAKS